MGLHDYSSEVEEDYQEPEEPDIHEIYTGVQSLIQGIETPADVQISKTITSVETQQ